LSSVFPAALFYFCGIFISLPISVYLSVRPCKRATCVILFGLRQLFITYPAKSLSQTEFTVANSYA